MATCLYYGWYLEAECQRHGMPRRVPTCPADAGHRVDATDTFCRSCGQRVTTGVHSTGELSSAHNMLAYGIRPDWMNSEDYTWFKKTVNEEMCVYPVDPMRCGFSHGDNMEVIPFGWKIDTEDGDVMFLDDKEIYPPAPDSEVVARIVKMFGYIRPVVKFGFVIVGY